MWMITKLPGETFKVGVDMAAELESGETFASVTAEAFEAAQAVTASLLGTPEINGTQLGVRLKAGLGVGDYVVNLYGTTSLGNIYGDRIKVRVI